MSTFYYQATDKSGKIREGEVTAPSKDVAVSLLQSHRLVITNLKEKKEMGLGIKLRFFLRIKPQDLVVFSKQLAVMISAGVPIVQALTALSRQPGNPKLRDVILKIRNDVNAGEKISDAFSKFPQVFSNFFVSVIKSGEISGNLSESLENLANTTERNYELRSEIKGALTYPLFILVSVFVIGGLVIVFVMPKLLDIFREVNVDLPFTTKVLISASDFIQGYWWLLILGIFGVIATLWTFARTQGGRQVWDRMQLKLPVFGELFKKIYMARFMGDLKTFVAGGVPIIQALRIGANSIGNSVYKDIIMETADRVEAGEPLAKSLLKRKEIPLMVSQMIGVGEQTGKLDQVCDVVSNFFSKEVNATLKSLTTLIEPLLILLIGGVVAIVVSAVIMPIYNLAQVI